MFIILRMNAKIVHTKLNFWVTIAYGADVFFSPVCGLSELSELEMTIPIITVGALYIVVWCYCSSILPDNDFGNPGFEMSVCQ